MKTGVEVDNTCMGLGGYQELVAAAAGPNMQLKPVVCVCKSFTQVFEPKTHTLQHMQTPPYQAAGQEL